MLVNKLNIDTNIFIYESAEEDPEVEFISKLLRMFLYNFLLQKGLIFW